MLAVGLLFRAPLLSDWDSWDYAAQAIQGHSSDLLLGRWWFVAAMRAVYLTGSLLGLPRLDGYLAMQAACAVAMAGAVVMGMAWVRRLTRSAAAEWIFAALIVPSPMIGVYTYSVMTEGPTLLMLMTAFWAWEIAVETKRRPAAWAVVAGLAFGVAVDMREPAALLCAWPVLSCLVDRPARRWRLLACAAGGTALTLGIGVIGGWAWYPWQDKGYFGNIHQWYRDMSAERRKFPVSLSRNVGFLFLYFGAAIPIATFLALPAVVWSIAARRWRLVALAASTLPLILSMLQNHDLAVNPRHPLPVIWVLTAVVAAGVDAAAVGGRSKRAVRLAATLGATLAVGAVILVLGWSTMKERYLDYVNSQRRIYRAMLTMPYDAVVVAGPGTPVALYLNRLGEKDFKVIGSGWGWPADVDAVVGESLAAGKTVYVYLEEDDWKRAARKSGEWDELQRAVAKYERGPAAGPLVSIHKHVSATAASASAQ